MGKYTGEYLKYLESDHWAELRKSALTRAQHQCEACCGRRLTLHGHHMIYRNPLESCTVEDIMAMCEKCHDVFHQWLTSERRYVGQFTRKQTIDIVQELLFRGKVIENLPQTKAQRKQARRAKRREEKRKQGEARRAQREARRTENQTTQAAKPDLQQLVDALTAEVARLRKELDERPHQPAQPAPVPVGSVVITKENHRDLFGINEGRSFNAMQLALLGEPYPLVHGWYRRIMGREIPLALVAEIKALSKPTRLDRVLDYQI